MEVPEVPEPPLASSSFLSTSVVSGFMDDEDESMLDEDALPAPTSAVSELPVIVARQPFKQRNDTLLLDLLGESESDVSFQALQPSSAALPTSLPTTSSFSVQGLSTPSEPPIPSSVSSTLTAAVPSTMSLPAPAHSGLSPFPAAPSAKPEQLQTQPTSTLVSSLSPPLLAVGPSSVSAQLPVTQPPSALPSWLSNSLQASVGPAPSLSSPSPFSSALLASNASQPSFSHPSSASPAGSVDIFASMSAGRTQSTNIVPTAVSAPLASLPNPAFMPSPAQISTPAFPPSGPSAPTSWSVGTGWASQQSQQQPPQMGVVGAYQHAPATPLGVAGQAQPPGGTQRFNMDELRALFG